MLAKRIERNWEKKPVSATKPRKKSRLVRARKRPLTVLEERAGRKMFFADGEVLGLEDSEEDAASYLF